MSNTALLDELLDPFAQCLDAVSARRVIKFGVSPTVQKNLELLAQRANEGALTDAELANYEALINAADFIAILQLKAQRKLKSNG